MVKDGRRREPEAVDACCFSVPSQHELLVEGRKICGSAQVRARGVFLQHGSILIKADPLHIHSAISVGGKSSEDSLKRLGASITSVYDHIRNGVAIEELCTQITRSFEENFDTRLIADGMTPDESMLKGALLRNKYMTDMWNLEGKKKAVWGT
jgi:lipoate-protein ligase A